MWLWMAARAPRCSWVAGRGEPSRKAREELGQRSTWTDPHQRGRPRGKGARTHQGHQNPKHSKGRHCWGARPGTPVCGTDAKRCGHAHTPRGPCSGAADLPQEQTHLQGSHRITASGKAPEETQHVTSEPAHVKTSRLCLEGSGLQGWWVQRAGAPDSIRLPARCLSPAIRSQARWRCSGPGIRPPAKETTLQNCLTGPRLSEQNQVSSGRKERCCYVQAASQPPHFRSASPLVVRAGSTK